MLLGLYLWYVLVPTPVESLGVSRDRDRPIRSNITSRSVTRKYPRFAGGGFDIYRGPQCTGCLVGSPVRYFPEWIWWGMVA
jgi:hypothetical protein